MPPILQARRATKEIAKLYLNGDKDTLILGDPAKYVKEGKVLKRHRTEEASLPFLL